MRTYIACFYWWGVQKALTAIQNHPSGALHGKFLQTIVGQNEDGLSAGGFVEMTITNQGTERHTVRPDGWLLSVTVAGVLHPGILVEIRDGTKVQMIDKTMYTIGPMDAIYEKATMGIAPGDVCHGWIQALFAGMKPSDLVSKGARWDIHFQDELETKYVASYGYKGDERLPAPQYYPGGGIRH